LLQFLSREKSFAGSSGIQAMVIRVVVGVICMSMVDGEIAQIATEFDQVWITEGSRNRITA